MGSFGISRELQFEVCSQGELYVQVPEQHEKEKQNKAVL